MRPSPVAPCIGACLIGMIISISGASSAHGDAIQAWSGASASTTIFGQTRSDQGATAVAGDQGSKTVNYEGSPAFNPRQYFDITVNGSAAASATGQADRLLTVSSHYRAGSPGTLGHGSPFVGPINSAANWNNDSVILTPPVGGSMPDSVRLQFAVQFQAPPSYPEANWQFGSMNVKANGQAITIAPTGYNWGASVSGAGFDTLTPAPTNTTWSSNNQYTGTLHLDLPVSKTGMSDPFQLALESKPNTGLMSNGGFYADQQATLALTDLTLLDGTSLTSLGYGINFASGMQGWPIPVPEPASLECWALLTVGIVAGAMLRRKATRSR